MSSIIKGKDLFNESKQAPSPSKDFANVQVTFSEVIWRYWRINPQCLKPNVRLSPTVVTTSHEDFPYDFELHCEIKRVFGNNTLEYIKQLCDGNYDNFIRLSNSLQIYIISFMELEDIATLSQTNKHFNQVCRSEQLWEHIIDRHCDTVTDEMRLYAKKVGWKRVFFTNKLQLRALMRRHQKESSIDN